LRSLVGAFVSVRVFVSWLVRVCPQKRKKIVVAVTIMYACDG
jgi:hypothetical protein